jgi:hypothetical protein
MATFRPAVGSWFYNQDEAGRPYQWDGEKWQGLPPSGKYPKTPTPRIGTSGGMGGGMFVGKTPPVFSAPTRPGPGSPILGPGKPIGCGYVAPVFPDPSSMDVLGGRINFGGYIPAASIVPFSVSTSDPILVYGTPNNGAGWGLTTAVLGPRLITAKWEVTVVPRDICAMLLIWFGGPNADVTFGPNGTALIGTPVLGTGVLPIAPPISASNWQLNYSHAHPGGFYNGVDFTALLLWATA